MLGLILSEQNREEESIQTYMESIRLNAEDAEVCYNLVIKLGARGDVKQEMELYEKVSSIF